MTTADASSGDAETLPAIREHLAERDLLGAERYVGSGYISGKQLAESEAAGTELVGPPLGDSSPQEFKLGDFQIDRERKRTVCPAGQVATKWAARTERDRRKAVHIQFPGLVCADCSLRARCTTGTGGRSLSLSEHYERVAARRAEAKTARFGERLRARPAIEATLSELMRKHGLRRHRYREDRKRHFENLLKGTACNLKRLTRVLGGLARGRSRPTEARRWPPGRWERDERSAAVAHWRRLPLKRAFPFAFPVIRTGSFTAPSAIGQRKRLAGLRGNGGRDAGAPS